MSNRSRLMSLAALAAFSWSALAAEVQVNGTDQTAKRMAGLKETLAGIAARVG